MLSSYPLVDRQQFLKSSRNKLIRAAICLVRLGNRRALGLPGRRGHAGA